MKTKAELTDFYYKTLHPTLNELEEMRKQVLYRILPLGVLFGVLLVFIILGAFLDSSFVFENKDLLLFVLFVFMVLGPSVYKSLTKDYKLKFKQNIIKPLIEAISKELSYNCHNHIEEYIFNRSDLFGKPDIISGNDYVKGLVKGTKIEFSDIHAQKKVRYQGKTIFSTLFRGLFIVAEFNKNFTTKTIVLPDSAQNTFGNLIGGWLQSNNFMRAELVRMDDNEFEREFVVYSNNQIEARYILSHSLMEKLLELKKRSKHPLYISFIENHIHIAIQYGKDLFEAPIFHSLDYNIAMEYVETIYLALDIVNDLNLNEKIWSKL